MEPGMFDPYLYGRMRDSMPRSDRLGHALAGPLEHEEFVRSAVGENPLLMAPAMALAIPAYTGAKYAGEDSELPFDMRYTMPGYALLKYLKAFPQGRSPASWDEIFSGYKGLFSGLMDSLTRK